MAILKGIRFFKRHPIFAIHSPKPFAYGKGAKVNARKDSIVWFDAREHGITVTGIVTNAVDELAVIDNVGRTFVFAPMTLDFWRERFPHYPFESVEDVLGEIEREWGG